MSGKKQFDEERALVQATSLFRHSGYAGTSIDDLLRVTGLSRSSLYSTFGTKEQLFLRVLNQYCEEMMQILAPENRLAPAVALRAFLQRLLDVLEAWGRPGGCLLTNSCGEAGSLPDLVRRRAADGLEEQVEQLRVYFQAARERHELPADVDVDHLATFFMSVRQSICLLWRAGSSRGKLEDVIGTSLEVLPATPVEPGQAAVVTIGAVGR